VDDCLVREGDFVLLSGAKRSYLVKVSKGKRFSFNEGIIDSEEIIGRQYGEEVTTHLGVHLRLVHPTLLDIVYRGFTRRTQVIYPKDAALIILRCGVGPGSRVVEAGTGSGCLTALLAHFVRPTGTVYTYEVRREFIDIARENLAAVGLLDYVVIKEKDVREGIEEKEVDAVILDMADPWHVIEHAHRALRCGGTLTCFLPTINQVERVVDEAIAKGFIMVETVELLLRNFKVKRGETRPEVRMIGHTGYIVFARKP